MLTHSLQSLSVCCTKPLFGDYFGNKLCRATAVWGMFSAIVRNWSRQCQLRNIPENIPQTHHSIKADASGPMLEHEWGTHIRQGRLDIPIILGMQYGLYRRPTCISMVATYALRPSRRQAINSHPEAAAMLSDSVAIITDNTGFTLQQCLREVGRLWARLLISKSWCPCGLWNRSYLKDGVGFRVFSRGCMVGICWYLAYWIIVIT